MSMIARVNVAAGTATMHPTGGSGGPEHHHLFALPDGTLIGVQASSSGVANLYRAGSTADLPAAISAAPGSSLASVDWGQRFWIDGYRIIAFRTGIGVTPGDSTVTVAMVKPGGASATAQTFDLPRTGDYDEDDQVTAVAARPGRPVQAMESWITSSQAHYRLTALESTGRRVIINDFVPGNGARPAYDGLVHVVAGSLTYRNSSGETDPSEQLPVSSIPVDTRENWTGVTATVFRGSVGGDVVLYVALHGEVSAPVTPPVFFQSGYSSETGGSLSAPGPVRERHEQFLTAVWSYLGSQVSGNNGEVLVLGDMWLPKYDGYAGEDYLFPSDLGWPYRTVAHSTGMGIQDRGIAAILDELVAGTYVPRLIYVEDDSQNNGPSSRVLTDEQYLVLRQVLDRGTTAMHLQISKPFSSGSAVGTPWLESFADGRLQLWSADQYDVISPAGGFPGGSAGYPLYRATDYVNVDDKPLLIGLPETEMFGWGWFVPTQTRYADLLAENAFVVAAQSYNNLPRLADVAPGPQVPIQGMFGIPQLPTISGRLKGASRRFKTSRVPIW